MSPAYLVLIGVFLWGVLCGWMLTLCVQTFVNWHRGKHREF